MEGNNLPSDEQDSKYWGGKSRNGERGYSGNYGSGGSSYGGNRPFRPAPVRVGEEFDVKIESMSKRGDAGVAKVEGLVIFVAGTTVGDSVKIRITKVGRGYATADVASNPNLSSESISDQEIKNGSSLSSPEGQSDVK